MSLKPSEIRSRGRAQTEKERSLLRHSLDPFVRFQIRLKGEKIALSFIKQNRTIGHDGPVLLYGGIQLNTERSQKQGIVQLHPGRMGAAHVRGGVQIHAGDGSGADALRISLQKPVLPVTDPFPVVRKGGMGIVYDLNKIHL